MKWNKEQVQLGAIFSLLAIISLNQNIFSDRRPSNQVKKIQRQPKFFQKPKLASIKNKKEIDIKNLDPAISQMWGIKKMNALKAWKNLNTRGSRDIIVAIIDTGIDINHPDLKANLWVNKGEIGKDSMGRQKATNGVDDDKNGCVDDVHGCNMIYRTGDIQDTHGHGTHIAGIIGATGGNGIGISGVSPYVSLMSIKYYDPKAKGITNLENTVRAIDYAVKNGAHIINYSGGGVQPSSEEKAAIIRSEKKGILFVAAAGNEKSNSDIQGYFPADYKLNNIISVTAFDRSEKILPTSNYGGSSVDLAAPGNNILSTIPGGKYGKMTGTSQATAFATGVAALIMSRYRDFDAKRVIKHLTETGDLDKKLAGKTIYKKRLNTYRALTILDQGVSLTGVVATNTNNFSEKTFSSENLIDKKNLKKIKDKDLQNKNFDLLTNFSKILRKSLSLSPKKKEIKNKVWLQEPSAKEQKPPNNKERTPSGL